MHLYIALDFRRGSSSYTRSICLQRIQEPHCEYAGSVLCVEVNQMLRRAKLCRMAVFANFGTGYGRLTNASRSKFEWLITDQYRDLQSPYKIQARKSLTEMIK